MSVSSKMACHSIPNCSCEFPSKAASLKRSWKVNCSEYCSHQLKDGALLLHQSHTEVHHLAGIVAQNVHPNDHPVVFPEDELQHAIWREDPAAQATRVGSRALFHFKPALPSLSAQNSPLHFKPALPSLSAPSSPPRGVSTPPPGTGVALCNVCSRRTYFRQPAFLELSGGSKSWTSDGTAAGI